MTSFSRDGGYGLVAFRLSDIPIDLRKRGARTLVNRSTLALKPDEAGLKGLMGTLMANIERGENTTDPEVIKRVAERPSDRVYWIPRPAWNEVMGA